MMRSLDDLQLSSLLFFLSMRSSSDDPLYEYDVVRAGSTLLPILYIPIGFLFL
jgi:hypothetical protein